MVGQDSGEELSGHVVICNCNDKVRVIVEELHNDVTHEPLDVVLIVQDKDIWDKNPEWHPRINESSGKVFKVLYGYPTDLELLQSARIQRAKAAVILADPSHGLEADAPSTLTAIAIEKQNPHVHTVMEMILSVNREHLKATDVNEIVCLGDISEKLIAQSCITPGVKNIFETLLTTREGTPQIFVPILPFELAGKTYRELCRQAITNDAPFITIGFIKNDFASELAPPIPCRYGTVIPNIKYSKFVINPRKHDRLGKDSSIDECDQLIIMAYEPPDLQTYLKF